MHQQAPKVAQLLDINEAAARIGLSVSCLYTWVSQKRIPYLKLGRCVRFDSRDIDKWLNSQRVEPDDAWAK